MEPKTFDQWLEGQFIEWISQTGKRHTVMEFSKYLGVPRPLLSRYLNGSRQPSRKTADLIATRLGPEVYDLLGFQRPDPLLQRLQAQWGLLNEAERAQIEQLVGQLEQRSTSK